MRKDEVEDALIDSRALMGVVKKEHVVQRAIVGGAERKRGKLTQDSFVIHHNHFGEAFRVQAISNFS